MGPWASGPIAPVGSRVLKVHRPLGFETEEAICDWSNGPRGPRGPLTPGAMGREAMRQLAIGAIPLAPGPLPQLLLEQ